MEDNMLPAVSSCIITGMTGGGKTSVLRSLLDGIPSDARCIVCQHHHGKAFGLNTRSPVPLSFAFDDARLAKYMEVFDFGSGCLCCSPDGDLTRALSNVARELEAGTVAFTHLIIETTGVADPRPFIRLLVNEPTIAKHFRLERVMSVVDLERGPSFLDLGNPKDKGTIQLANCEVVVLNKAGRLAASSRERTMEKVESRIRGVNADAKFIVAGEQGEVQWCDVLEADRRDRSEQYRACGACVEEAARLVSLQGHDDTYKTVCVEERGGVILEEARRWLEDVLDRKEAEEVKGYLAVTFDQEPNDAETLQKMSGTVDPVQPSRRVLVHGVRGDVQMVAKPIGGEHVAMRESLDRQELERGLAGEGESDCKLFFLGKNAEYTELSEGLRFSMAPHSFLPVADLDLDFPDAAAFVKANEKEQLGRHAQHIDLSGDDLPDVALFWVNGWFYALKNKCPHAGSQLTGGQIEDGVATCTRQSHEAAVGNQNGQDEEGGGEAGLVKIHSQPMKAPAEDQTEPRPNNPGQPDGATERGEHTGQAPGGEKQQEEEPAVPGAATEQKQSMHDGPAELPRLKDGETWTGFQESFGPSVTCPAHLFKFDLATGWSIATGYRTDVYPVWVVGNTVFVGEEAKRVEKPKSKRV